MTKQQLLDLVSKVPDGEEIFVEGADFAGYDVITGKGAVLYIDDDYNDGVRIILAGLDDDGEHILKAMNDDKHVVRIIDVVHW